MSDNSKFSFKIYYKNTGEVRRISFPKKPTYDELINTLQSISQNSFHPELNLSYIDSEGDSITITSDPELEELYNQTLDKVIKLYITEQTNKLYFKDSPTPSPVKIYSETTKEPSKVTKEPSKVTKDLTQTLPSTSQAQLSSSVTKALHYAFPSGKVLPYNIPIFLQSALKIKNLPNNEVDLDVDIINLYNSMDREALRLLDSKSRIELERGRDLLIGSFEISQEPERTQYNLACAYSLLKDAENGLKALQKAIDLGYRDLSHIGKDVDLVYLRDCPGFIQIISNLVKAINGQKEDQMEKERLEQEKERRIEEEKFEEEKRQMEEERKRAEEEQERKRAEEEEERKRVEEEKRAEEEERKRVEEEKQSVELGYKLSSYSQQLQILHSMGFEDVVINFKALTLHKGDLRKAISHILESRKN